MARTPSDRQQSERVRRSFGEILNWHLVRGTRPGGHIDRPGRKWSQQAFADAVGVNYRTIGYWKKDEHLPKEIETIERLLFGSDICYDDWRLELRNAHEAGWSAKSGEDAAN